MLGYYEGYSNDPAQPMTGKEWYTLKCDDCGVEQTHHKAGNSYKCVVCGTTKSEYKVSPNNFNT